MKPFVVLFLLAASLHAADAGSAAATVNKETDLTTITLKPEAEQRLQLKLVKVERRVVPAVRLFAGDIVVPLAAKGDTAAPVLGGTLDEFLRLADLQTAADGRMLQTQVQVAAAKLALERAQKVLNAEAGSVRSVDEAKAALHLAQAALTTATEQRQLLGEPAMQARAAKRLWVRVAVFSGEAGLLDDKAAVSLRALTAAQATMTAKPVAGPQTANALTSTVDWFYELETAAGLRAGERIAVEIPTRGSGAESLVVPFNAVLHDINGGQWVYENTAPHIYTRRRVQVARVAGADAVLTSGPPIGTNIVTAGAAELFGTEFATGK